MFKATGNKKTVSIFVKKLIDLGATYCNLTSSLFKNTYLYICHIAAIIFISSALFASPASATEFLVNTTIASTQIDTSVAALTGGGFVISWTDNSGTLPDNSSSAIRARRYDASGTALDASDFLVNTVINNAQHFSSVAGLSGGDFVIVWQDNIGDGSVGGIRARRYNAAGTALDTPEFLVNTTINNWQQTPSVAALTGGGFVIAWVDHSGVGDTSPSGIRARRFDASGTALDTNDFLVNTTIQNAQSNPSVAALTSGGFVIAWTDDSQSIDDPSLQAVRARRYNASGVAQGSDFPVNTITSSRQQFPSVAGLSGDGFIITWEDASLSPNDTSSWAVRARRYDGTGAALDTPEFLVNTTTSGKQIRPSVTALSGGGFGIAWTDRSVKLPDNSAEAIRLRRYDANGVALDTSDFVANTIIFNRQEFPSVAGLSGGDFVITWEDRSNSADDPFSSAIRADIFAVAPEMDVAGMGQSIPDGNAAPATADDTDFGSADIASGSVAHTFTVSNSGTAVLNLTGTPRVVIGGTNAGDFSLTTDAATTVAAGGGTTTFTVTFNPNALGTRTATISIANDDANENPYNFAIQGTGTGSPEMDVAGMGQSILDGDSTPVSTDDTDYGAVALTGGSVAHTFTVSNSGPVVLNLTGTPRVVIGGTNAGDFSLTTDAAISAAAGGTTTFTVTFNPGANGTRTATISIANDDANENPYNFTIQGTGINTSPTGSATISGTATQGQTLSAVTTSIGDADGLGTFSYQWKRGGTNIATTSTYALVQADVGSTLTVTVSYTDGGGTAESLTSTATASVANVNDAPTGAVTISGTATQGQTLTAVTTTIADIDGLGTFSYQWKRGGTNIATTSTYALVQADVGSTLTVTVSYTDGFSTAESLTSAATASVANINDAPTGAVVITGTAAKFQSLSAVTTSIADIDGLGAFSYLWKRGSTTISGATGTSYALTQADVGKTITAVVSYTDGFGAAESLTSTATASVVHVNTPSTGAVIISGTAAQGQTLTADASAVADVDGLGAFTYQWQRNGV
ncbi:MAG: hypothetical protein COA85_13570, partial [Robiginitomaculum sp.]